MAISPGTYNISMQRRADYYVTLQFKDGTGAPINLTDWIAEAEIWNKQRTTKFADFTITYTNRATGTISLALTDTETTALPTKAYYDVLLINPSSLREYYLEGDVNVYEGYST
jgi:hypothetical protein